MATGAPVPAGRPWQYNIYWIFSMMGMGLIVTGFIIGLILQSTARDYWADYSKIQRDCAGIDLINYTGFGEAANAAANGLVAACQQAAIDQAESDFLGAELREELEEITTYPRWVTPLIFVGVASFMVGIALEFSAIPGLLQNRGRVIGAAYTQIVRGR